MAERVIHNPREWTDRAWVRDVAPRLPSIEGDYAEIVSALDDDPVRPIQYASGRGDMDDAGSVKMNWGLFSVVRDGAKAAARMDHRPPAVKRSAKSLLGRG